MSKVALVIGAGPGVGKASAESLAAAGFTVAVASRTNKGISDQFRHYAVDTSKPVSVPGLFEQVRKDLGAPSVVIYNAYGFHGGDPKKPFNVDILDVEADFAINAISPYVSAAESIKGFQELKSSGKLGQEGATYIFTGNVFASKPYNGGVAFSMGKAASKNLILALATTLYQDEPFKFYFGDERTSEGGSVFAGIDGPAHAEHYLKLVQDPKQQAYDYTFVKGKGYVKFDDGV